MEINQIIEEICTREVSERKIAQKPLCVIIGGLPGAGKTNLVRKIIEEHGTY